MKENRKQSSVLLTTHIHEDKHIIHSSSSTFTECSHISNGTVNIPASRVFLKKQTKYFAVFIMIMEGE